MDASVFVYREAYFRNQLQGLLNDICNVYFLICQKGHQLPNDENKIRDEFSLYFEDSTFKATTTTAKNYHYDPEAWLPKTAGRVDMRFLSPDCYGAQDEFIAIECKRLDGKSHLSKEYVDNGIRRYTGGKYPSEYLRAANIIMAGTLELESQHVKPYAFVLHHLWMDFSGLVT